MVFNFGLWWYLRESGNPDAGRIGMEFLTGCPVEKALAVDNIFVFLLISNYFSVPPQVQQRVLIYDVLGAIVLRGKLIFVGAVRIQQFHWILYLFGLFLLVTGIRMIVAASHEPDRDKNLVRRWLAGHLPLTRHYVGEAFRDGREILFSGLWPRRCADFYRGNDDYCRLLWNSDRDLTWSCGRPDRLGHAVQPDHQTCREAESLRPGPAIAIVGFGEKSPFRQFSVFYDDQKR